MKSPTSLYAVRRWMAIAVALGALVFGAHDATADDMLNLNASVIVHPENPRARVAKAVEMLSIEVAHRSGITWPSATALPADKTAAVVVGTMADLRAQGSPFAAALDGVDILGAEGFAIKVVTSGSAPVIYVAGQDDRGMFFGVGRLLRELRMSRQSVMLPAGLAANTSPETSLRGHQLGYRPKVNTYDGWTVPMWEQHIRDLVVFGNNAIEMMPPKTDDDADSPHFPLPQLEMMQHISRIADEYDMAVWIWYPAMAKDYSDKATVDRELAEWGEVFKAMPRLDAVFVPGGDPGHTQPKYMMALLEKQTEVLHKSHPNAQMWMSPQGFTQEWMDEYIAIMQKDQPKWLSGVVFGPQNRLSLPDLRKLIPQQYPIRHYPDITHSYSCQYPVHDWDVAYRLTQDREVINPRPVAFAEIYQWAMQYTNGFISYSEGCNDDVNKVIWSALGWDSKADINQVLREYARYFIAPELEDGFSKALFSLERNWTGPLLTNTGVTTTLRQVEDMERIATPQVLLNWRFQHVVYRANYDAFVRRRLIYETELEEQAMEVLRRAKPLGSLLAVNEAEAILNRAKLDPAGQALRGRVSDMAEALYQSIRMQLSMPKYRAIDPGRGANFDYIDRALNNSPWLVARFNEIRALANEDERLKAISDIVNWTNPGPGGYYDDLGDPTQQPHLVRSLTLDPDPENRVNPLLGYTPRYAVDGRISWFVDAESRFEAPLKMQYAALDPTAQYAVRVIYAGDKFDTQMRMLADDETEVHGLVDKPFPLKALEYDIPKAATADGNLTLTWYQTPGRGSAGRGCQVTEVWLVKK